MTSPGSRSQKTLRQEAHLLGKIRRRRVHGRSVPSQSSAYLGRLLNEPARPQCPLVEVPLDAEEDPLSAEPQHLPVSSARAARHSADDERIGEPRKLGEALLVADHEDHDRRLAELPVAFVHSPPAGLTRVVVEEFLASRVRL